jgi:hypothetical protein
VHKLEGAAKLDVKFGFGSGHSDNDSLRYQYDNAGNLLDRFTDTASVRDRSASTGGKYSTPIGKQARAGGRLGYRARPPRGNQDLGRQGRQRPVRRLGRQPHRRHPPPGRVRAG